MANGVSLPEDFLRIGEPAANRRSVLSAILEAMGGEDAIRGVGATSAPLTEEARIAALTTRLEIPPDDSGVDLGGVRQAAPQRPGREKERRTAQTGEGFYEWIDERGVSHVTDKPETAPRGATFKPFEPPTITGVGGAKLFGEVTPETITALGRAGETDQQRESRLIREIAKETGKDISEATKAFRESRAEISGVPTAPETFEEKSAMRDKIIQNTEKLLKQNPENRTEILRQSAELMRLRGLGKLKKPEQTITATIEGQKVEIPVSKWKSEYGSEAKGKATSNIREAQWLITHGVAKNEKEAYRMVKKAMSKETTEQEWAITVRKNLMKDEFLDESERQEKYDAEIEWFRNLPGKGRSATTVRGVGGQSVVPTGKAERRVLPDGRVLVKDAKGNITVEG